MNLLESGDDVPQVCVECMGTSGTNRLLRDKMGGECRVCHRGFVTYTWKSQNPSIVRQTVICKPCAVEREACQSCALDINYRISLALRETVLRVLVEEGGTDKDGALSAVSNWVHEQRSTHPKKETTVTTKNIRDWVAQFPVGGTPRPPNCLSMYVYGIEPDFDVDALRSYLKASIRNAEVVPEGNYAFFEFDNESNLPTDTTTPTVIDGRKLVFAWGSRVPVPKHMHKQVGAVIRAYLRAV